MTFVLKNAGATYQRPMNLIFHDLLGNASRKSSDKGFKIPTSFQTDCFAGNDIKKQFKAIEHIVAHEL